MSRDRESSAGTDDAAGDDQPVLSLPETLREELKEPFGPIETDADAVIASLSGPLIAVGDIVTYHFLQAGFRPDIALVDGQTKRSAVEQEIERAVTDDVTLEVENPPAEITGALVETLREALAADEPTTILVDGEEDLAALPAIVAAPEGASVVYGQPDVGMVHVQVDDEARAEVRSLLERFDGDLEGVLGRLEN